MDIAAFLTDRLDEDERVARAATAGPWEVDDVRYVERITNPDGAAIVDGSRWGGEARVFDSNEDAVHIARHDPARVLTDVAATRELIRRFHEVAAVGMRYRDGEYEHYVECACGWTSPMDYPYDEARIFEQQHRWQADQNGGTPRWVLLMLAQPYVDHPDFDPTWGVETATT